MNPKEQGSGSDAPMGSAPGTRQGGLVTLLFTDLVGSTAIKQNLGDFAGVALVQQHHALVRQLLKQFPQGEEISTAGDSFFLVFIKPSDAVRFALMLQCGLQKFNQDRSVPLHDRVGLHLGEVVIEETGAGKRDLHGMQVDTCARVMSLARAGQILMTRAVFDNARQSLKGEEVENVGSLNWLNHGRFELKGVEEPVEICEVRSVDAGEMPVPATSEKARFVEAPGEEPVLGWRPAVDQLVPHTQWLLEKKLGEGGFGEVWLGRHQTMKERRVFKFCFRADRVRSLKREMTLFRLIKERIGDHPNIVRLLEVNFEEPPFYVEQDYVESQDLANWCGAQGGADKVPLETKLDIVAEIAAALQAAHDAGVIHRDVKPGNILVSATGAKVTAKLTDFGIGQVVSEDALKGVTRAGFTRTIVADSSSSHTGSQMYMAPELLAGKPASTRSDIYSLGVVLFQLLIGDFERPVTTDWADEIAEPLLREDLRNCFAGRPSDRFSAAGELGRNLRALGIRREVLARQQAELAAREKAAYRRGIVRAAALASAIVALLAVLAIVAVGQSRKARLAATRAEAGEQRARRNLYAADMLLAAQALKANNRGRAVQLLERNSSPGVTDARGWEWRYLRTLCRSEAVSLTPAHSNRVSDVAFSPRGDLLYSSSEDANIKVWDVARASLHSAHAQPFPIQAMALSPDGKWLVLGSMDGQLTKCDTQVWTNAPFAQPGSAILDLLFSPAGDKLAVRRRSEIAVLQWNENRIATVLHSATVSRHGQSMAFSSNGELLAYPAPGGKVAISGCGTDSVSRVLSGVMDTINSIAISPDDRMLAAADWSPRIAVLDLASGAELSSLTNHAAWISSVAFLPDGKGLVSASADQTIRHWNTTGWQEVAIRRGHLDEVNCLATSPRGDWMASGGKDGALNLWTTKPALRQATRLEFEGSRGLLSLDARTLLLVGSDGMLTRWDALALRPQASNNSREMLGTHTALGLGVQRLAVGRPGGKVEIWSIANWSRVLELKPSSEEVFSLRFSLDESLLAAVNSSQQLSIWDCSDGRQVAGIGPFKINISAVEFSPSKKRVSIGFTDGSIQVWNLTPSFLFRNLRGQSQGAWAEHMQFSPDGCSLATGNPDATLRIWNLDNGSFASLPRALMAYFSVAYSPDGGRLAAAGPDPVVRIIDTATGEEVAALDRNTKYRDFADLVRFSADGNALLILTGNSLTVWHAASLSEIEGSDRVPANPNLR